MIVMVKKREPSPLNKFKAYKKYTAAGGAMSLSEFLRVKQYSYAGKLLAKKRR